MIVSTIINYQLENKMQTRGKLATSIIKTFICSLKNINECVWSQRYQLIDRLQKKGSSQCAMRLSVQQAC